jgi:hypothetical protein
MMLTTILFFLTIYPDYIALNRQLLKAAIADWQRAISSDPQKLQKLPSDVQANDKQAARFKVLDEDQPLR